MGFSMDPRQDHDASNPLDPRFRRQVAFAGLGHTGQKRLLEARVAIVGLGALGSSVAMQLTRCGVGYLKLIDRDWVETDNLPRQVLSTDSDARQRLPKAVAAATHLKAIWNDLKTEIEVADLTWRNAQDLLGDCHLVIDGTDNFLTRYVINECQLETGIPWVHAGVVGASGQVIFLQPGKTPCFRCLVPEPPRPEDQPTCDTAGVLLPAVQMITAHQAMLAVQYLSHPDHPMPMDMLLIDGWRHILRSIATDRLRSVGCPSCQGSRDFLRGKAGGEVAVLCGRNAVQITPTHPQETDLGKIAKRWEGQGLDRSNPFLVRWQQGEWSITLFRDGRAVVGGTEDPAVARSLLARWVGN
jgi:adenylyltransferase/sulfurtransferase